MTEYDDNADLNAAEEDYMPAPQPAKKRQGLLIGILALLVLGGGGFFAWTLFMPSNDFAYTPPPAPLAPAPDMPTEGMAEAPVADLSAEALAQVEMPAPEEVTVEMPAPEALAATVDAVNDVLAQTEPETEAEPVIVPPPVQQLQPIEPKNEQEVAPTAAEAVKDILGTDAQMTPAQQDAQIQNIAEQVEVTPRAKQVIVVKKAYSAQSGPAVNAAGGRVLAAGNYNDAVEIYDSQLARNPSDPIALTGKALALQKAGREAEALDLYQRLLDLNPRDLEVLTNYLGLLQKQKPEEALTRLEALEGQYPESALVAGQIAMASATLMDTPRALKSFQKAIALDPSNPVYPYNMAVLYDRLGTVDRARDAYLRTLRVVRDNPEREKSVPVETIRRRLQSLSS